ncbi:SOS response-associated peptidase [Kaistella palustris]|uniref:SOS response-associated peptidase n=1 Tax=Kaistella palustris TaxID=493376 RepID=UPI0003F64D77|nr:SOS response-associated peptidase [Kaistella palustris]
MCYYVSNSLTRKEMKDTFGVTYNGPDYESSDFVNGFSFPQTPIVIDENPAEAVLGDWGLLPSWAQDRSFRKSTLNARIETLTERSSFRESVHNRCLVLVNGFYEWKWLDAQGKRKEKYFIRLENGDKPFALGGIYNIWRDRRTAEVITSFSIVTSDANELMAEIHNTKDRMPLVLTQQAGKAWLKDHSLEDFSFPDYSPDLVAINLDGQSQQLTLF